MLCFGARALVAIAALAMIGCGDATDSCVEARNPYAVQGVGSLSAQHAGKKANKFDIYVEVVRNDGIEIDACQVDASGTLWRIATAWGRLEGAELPVELSLTDRKQPYFSGFLVLCPKENCPNQKYAMHTDPLEPASGSAEVVRYSLEAGRLSGSAEIDNADKTTTRLDVDVNW